MKFTLLSFLAILSINCLVLISPTIAQTTEQEELAGEFSVVVDDIRVEGLQRIEPGTVFSLIDIELKEVVDRKKVSEAIKVLFNSGFFEDVKVFLEGNSLIVELKERPSIGSIDISGSKEFKEEALLEALKKIGLFQSEIFNRNLLEKAEQALKNQYLSRGKYNVKIESTISPLLRNRVAIGIVIEEGDDARIEEIKIYGANEFEEKDLLNLFSQRTKNWLSWYTKSNQYSREKLDGDLEKLRSFYLDRGYVKFEIISKQVSLSPDRTKVFVSILINEGKVFKVGTVKIIGDLLGQSEYFNENLLLKTGDVFSNINFT